MSKKVLVVEDDFDTLHPLAELLRLKGFDVVTASEAEVGLTLARSQKPDLIITDIVLPGKSGLHFISTIRNDPQVSATPIVVISGCGPMIMVEAESAGADCCLDKPINIDLFWDALNQVLGTSKEAVSEKQVKATPARPTLASEIDSLVEELRHCSSRDEKEEVLKRLKEHVLELQARNSNRL